MKKVNKKKLLFACALLLSCSLVRAQAAPANAVLPKDTTINNIVFTKVEVDSEFPGGIAGWSQYLQTNLDGNVPVKNGYAERQEYGYTTH